MAKKFNIHEWQAEQQMKQWLSEADDFTPDLEDDDLKRSKIQQMMAKEKEPMGGDEKLRSNVEAIANMYSYGEILDAIESFYVKNDEQVYAKMARKHAKEFRDFLDDEDELDEEMLMEEENIPELSDQEKDNLHDMVIEFARKLTDVRGGNYSGNKLLAALQYVTLEIENLEPMIYDDEDGDGIPDAVDDEDDLDEANVTGTGTTFNAGDGEGYATPNAFAKKGKWKNKNKKYPEE